MPLNPKFSLTPRDSFSYSWNYFTQEYVHWAGLYCSGVFLKRNQLSYSLTEQYQDDKAFLYGNPVSPSAPEVLDDYYKHSVANVLFKTNATTDNQYLFLFHVDGWGGSAAFYINGNLVRTEEVDGAAVIAILVDCPPSQELWNIVMALVCDESRRDFAGLVLSGVECYVL